MKKLTEVKNKWFLVTGASSGIGEVFVRELAARGANLILVARNEAKLRAIAQSLKSKVLVDIIPMDLSLPDAPQKLFEKTQSLRREVFGLINNAGFAVYGRFHESSFQKNQEEILLNTFALASLTQLFISSMVKANEGVIINVASTAAFQPLPFMANYGASKAFVLSFTEALWGEYQHTGLKILAVCPGSTETPFFDVVGAKEASVGKRDTPENVVKSAFRALDCGRSYVITGPKTNYWLAQLGRLLPRAMIIKTTRKVLQPREK